MTAADPQAPLRAFAPRHPFFVGIDSDGCAFNSMEVKHNDCFAVNVVKHFGLAAVSRQVHEVWDFVNLYSRTRGCNRFKALALAMDHLRAHPRVRAAGVTIPELPALRAWMQEERTLGNPTLAARLEQSSGAARAELELVLRWSKGVNAFVADIVHDLPPFPGARAALDRLAGRADVLVVSATPAEALEREWAEHGIAGKVALIAGQEMGSKVEHLTLAAQGKYAADAILMIGDAPGDLQAARAIGALFYPIVPGEEQPSWERFCAEAMDRFFARRYAGPYEQELIDAFLRRLPEAPPWG